MKGHSSSKAMLLVLAAFVLASSCTNEKYALTEENIDTQVQVFSDGLTLPLGSIDKIQLKDLLGQVGESEAGNFLAAMEDGTYAINLSDSYDLSESLNEMLEDLKIDAVKYEDKFSFNLGAVDVSSVTIDAMTFPEEPYEVLFSEVIGDVELDPVSIELTPDPIEVEISKYMPESLDLDFELEPLSSPVLKVGDNIQLSESLLNDVEVSLDMFSSYISMPAFNVEESIPVEISLPKGVKEVGSVILDKDAAISVKVALENPFVKAGEIVPEVELDLSGIFAVKDTEGGVIDLSVMKLTGENGFSAEAVYPITSIILDEDNWAVSKDGKYEYKADVPVSAAGQLETKNLTTTTKLLYNNRSTNLKVALEFVDLGIADVKMNVDPLEVTAAEVVEVEFSAELPEQVGGIGHVAFDKTSAITVTLKPSNLDKFKDLDVTLDNLTLTFPKGMVVKDAVEGVISKTDVDLKSGYELKVQVEKFELPDLDKNNTLAYTGQIKVDVEASVGGWVNTASLPAKPEDDIKFEVSVDGELAIEDYNVALKQVSYELDPMKEEICIDVPADIKDLGSVVIYPECSDDTAAVPAITLDFVLPDVDLPIRPADGGLCISLPQMLRFSDLPASYNYDAKSHSVCFKDELPSKIVLPVEKIVITPEADGDKYVVKGAISVEGGITLDACEITKEVLEQLRKSKISVSAYLPGMKPATVDIDSYTASISEEFVLDLDLGSSLPKELKEIGRVDLKDVYLDFSLDAKGLPDLKGADISLDLALALPEMIVVEDTRLEDGILSISGSLNKDGIIAVDPIKIEALDLTGCDLSEGIDGKIKLDGVIELANASLDIDEWIGDDKNHSMAVSAVLATKSDAEVKTIEIEKVQAKVDYQIEAMSQRIDLSTLADLSGVGADIDFSLDLTRFNLALDLTTNVNIPLAVDLQIVPYYDGQASEEKTLKATLSTAGGDTASKKFWISNTDAGMPAGYTYVKLDLLSLLRGELPQYLDLSISGGTIADQYAEVNLSEEIILKADYNLNLPLEPGEEFKVEFKTTIDNLPPVVGQVLSMGSVGIIGEFENSLPLRLAINLNIVDSKGKIIASADQMLQSRNADGSASISELNLVLKKAAGADASDVSALEVVVVLDPGNASGQALTENDYIAGTIKLAIPEGVTVDIKDLGGLMGDEE